MGRKRRERRNKPKDPFVERRAAALKALKEYQNKGSFRENYSEIVDVLVEESDRGAIILVGGVIEDLLSDRIIERLPNGNSQRDDLLRQGGLLNSFQSKVTMALALGLIDEATVDSLDIIRQLRNACAHSRFGVTLSIPQVNRVFALLLSKDAAEDIEDPVNPEYLRLLLSFVAVYHFELILGRTKEHAQQVVDGMVAKTRQYIAEEAKRAASPETPSQPPGPDDPLDQKA